MSEHDLSRIEPAFWRPDAYFAVPPEARPRRISDSDGACLISSEDGQTLAADCEHAFAVEARSGVAAERALEWRSWFAHGGESS